MTPPPSHSRLSPDVQTWKVGSITREANSCEGSHTATRSSICSWPAPQVSEGALAPLGRGRRSFRCPNCVSERLFCLRISTSPWCTASCCRDGSLAVIQPLWVQPTAEELSFCGRARPHFAINVRARNSCWNLKKPSLVPLLPCLFGRGRRLRNKSFLPRQESAMGWS